jgi:hypothetical protein
MGPPRFAVKAKRAGQAINPQFVWIIATDIHTL